MVEPDLMLYTYDAWTDRTITTGVQKTHTPFIRFHYTMRKSRCGVWQWTQNKGDSVLSRDYKFMVYQINIDSVLLWIDGTREDLWESHAWQCHSTNCQ
jgi:hypothetical protein